MAYSKKEREHYNIHRERVGKELGLSKNEYNRLRRVGNELTKHDTDYANGDIAESKEHEKRVGKAFSKTKALKGKVHFYHQRDPRGAALYAAKKRIHPDKYSSEGHVIY